MWLVARKLLQCNLVGCRGFVATTREKKNLLIRAGECITRRKFTLHKIKPKTQTSRPQAAKKKEKSAGRLYLRISNQ